MAIPTSRAGVSPVPEDVDRELLDGGRHAVDDAVADVEDRITEIAGERGDELGDGDGDEAGHDARQCAAPYCGVAVGHERCSEPTVAEMVLVVVLDRRDIPDTVLGGVGQLWEAVREGLVGLAGPVDS